jgi:hypothetical protein
MVCRLSIYSNNSHFWWLVRSSITILKVDTLRMIQANIGWNRPNSFRGKDFKNNLCWSDGQWQLTQDDGNTSYDTLDCFLLIYFLGKRNIKSTELKQVPFWYVCEIFQTNQSKRYFYTCSKIFFSTTKGENKSKNSNCFIWHKLISLSLRNQHILNMKIRELQKQFNKKYILT